MSNGRAAVADAVPARSQGAVLSTETGAAAPSRVKVTWEIPAAAGTNTKMRPSTEELASWLALMRLALGLTMRESFTVVGMQPVRIAGTVNVAARPRATARARLPGPVNAGVAARRRRPLGKGVTP